MPISVPGGGGSALYSYGTISSFVASSTFTFTVSGQVLFTPWVYGVDSVTNQISDDGSTWYTVGGATEDSEAKIAVVANKYRLINSGMPQTIGVTGWYFI